MSLFASSLHLSAQRPGFKFLVAQLMCDLTGGPQKYTGLSMAASHKHLNISEEEIAMKKAEQESARMAAREAAEAMAAEDKPIAIEDDLLD